MISKETFIENIKADGITVNAELEQALLLAEYSKTNLFITGNAGTGKSVFIQELVKHSSKRIIVLAPTGIAAIHVGGQTVHSFFKFPIGIMDKKKVTVSQLLRDAWDFFDVLLIDEISMLRADVTAAVDAAMKKMSKSNTLFGGKQIISVGDMYQLPPVVAKNEKESFFKMYQSKWWFSSIDVSSFEIIEFTEVFRQTNKTFISALNNIRKGNHSAVDISLLNSRLQIRHSKTAITVTTTNDKADQINKSNLDAINSPRVVLSGSKCGIFPDNVLPVPIQLELKVGARVVVLRNDKNNGVVNGTMGDVIEINKKEEFILIKVGYEVKKIKRSTWHQFEYEVIDGHLSKEEVGSYTQYPLKLAYAVTVHRSQGSTYDEVIIDFNRGTFESGQAYVALSRVRSLEGLYLKKPVTSDDIKVDCDVRNFFAQVVP